MNKIITSLLLLTSMSIGFGQFENNRWYFHPSGDWGLHFDTASNVPSITHEHITPYANEGSCIADNPNTGELMFYCTGDRVMDLSHQIMPNGSGLISNTSTSTKGLICPKPGNCNQYYIFQNTSVIEASSGNYYYSVVDMSLIGNGASLTPLGDVVPGQKNIFLKNNTGEASIIIRSTSTNKFWLLVSTFDANELCVYRIDSTGITLHTTFNVPFTITDFRHFDYNYKFNKLSSVSGVENEPSLIMDFDRSTGALSSCIAIPGTPVGSSPWYFEGMFDAEWSPDGTKLYIGKWRSPSTSSGGQIFQYDLNFPLNNVTSIYNVGGTTANVIAGLKLGPDGKIYFVHVHPTQNFRYIGTINSPNVAGLGCNPIGLALDLGTNPGSYIKFSSHLPINSKPVAINDTILANCGNANIDSIEIINNDIDIDDNSFSISFINTPSNVSVSLNADNSVNIDLGNVTAPNLIIPYVICDNTCFSKCDTAFILVLIAEPSPINFLPEDTFVCDNNSIILTPSISADGYQWDIGPTTSSITIATPGIYGLEIDLGGCLYYDSTVVTTNFSPYVDLGPDSTYCNVEYIILDATFPSSDYLWSNGSNVSQIPVSTSGLYSVIVTNICGSYSDSIEIVLGSSPYITLGPDTSICPGDSISLQAFYPGSNTLWSNGATTPVIYVDMPGIYWATVSNDCGTSTDSIEIGVKKCLGVEDYESQILVYPNPADNYIVINLSELTSPIESITLFDIAGKQCLVYSSEFDASNITLDISTLTPGLYILELSSNNQRYRKKIIVQ